MILLSKFDQLCTDIRAAVPAIKTQFIVADEEHAVTKLKDTAGVILLAIIPSAVREGENNAGIDADDTWFFILEKGPVDQSNQKEIEQYTRLQEIILQVREFIEEGFANADPRLRRYRPASTKIDPEYKEFGGFNGWSMSVVF